MVKKKNKKVDAIVAQFAAELKKDIPLEKIILFGSYLKGRPAADSDIDLIVVSSFFARKNHIANMQYLFRKAAKVSSLLEPVPATPAEIAHPDKRLFLGQILKLARVYNFS